ncbi:MAG: response regulator [Chloroflexi bacterium]|nr:response regulator [Chloroflexota bacterium]
MTPPAILIIDDDIVLLARLATQLKEAGYTALQAADVRQAEQLLDDTPVDLVLLDTAMARGAGWQLLPRLAARVPTIIVSGDGLEEDVVRGLDAGALDYLTKPFRTGELLARIRAHLRVRSGDESGSAGVPSRRKPVPTNVTEPGDGEGPASDMVPDSPAAEGVSRPEGDDRAGEQRGARSRRSRNAAEEEEPVFIPYAEERRLLDTEGRMAADEVRASELEQLPLGARLRAARQRRRITLVQAELDTRIRMSYIQAMEEEKFALLPHGPIAETMVQTYAAYLGLNVGQAGQEYRQHHYSAPLEPLIALGGAALPRPAPPWWLWAIAVVLALGVGIGGIFALDPAGAAALGQRARALVMPPTATPTPSPSPTPSITATVTPTATPSATASATPGITPTATSSATPEPTMTPTATLRPRATARPTAPPTPEPPTPEPPTPEPPTPEPPTPEA